MFRYLTVAIIVLASAMTASAGPLRQWIHDHRPAIIIPRRDVVIEPTPPIQQAPLYYYYYYAQQPVEWYTGVQPACANGSCPVKR